jgi:hypothetical protein
MINVFFVPGMFGSTLEYVLINYTQEHIPTVAEICKDGSMHYYAKQAHLIDRTDISQFIANKKLYKISTPIYPFKQYHLPEILLNFDLKNTDHNLLIYADCNESAELNMLFQYHKIAFGATLKAGLDIFSGSNSHNIVGWNKNYTSWEQMQPWEWREWFSLFYTDWLQEWQQSVDQVPDYFLKIKNTDLLFETEQTMCNVIKFCNLTLKPKLSEFIKEWQNKQQYIVDEFELLSQIVNCTLTQQYMSWEPTNIVAEAIVQQRLRSKGYEMKCDGLNTFPTNSKTLYNLLEKI